MADVKNLMKIKDRYLDLTKLSTIEESAEYYQFNLEGIMLNVKKSELSSSELDSLSNFIATDLLLKNIV